MRAIPQRLANAGSHRTAWWRTHSHSNLSPHPNSRLSGKITGNFVNRMLYRLFAGVKQPTFRGGLAKIPCEIESGIFCREPGHFRQANGKFSQRQLEGAPFANTRHKRWSWRLNPEPRARLRAFRTLAAVPFICEERPPCLYSTRTWVRSPVVV
jgi:hypothetical protein